MKLYYSIIKYSPILSTTTPITLGILFHEPSLDFRAFRFAHDLSHLSQFYPDVDIEIVEKLLRGIREEVEMWNSVLKPFDVEEYTRFWLNDFSFRDIEMVECEDLDETIARISKEYL